MKQRLILALAALAFTTGAADAQIRDPLKVQEGREKRLQLRGSKPYYTEQWNLEDLPAYAPKQRVSGVIRQRGSNEELIEFTNYKNADGSTELEAKQVLDAVSKDPLGIGYSTVAFLTPATKAIAIAPRASDKYVELNLQTVRSRKYPLADEVYFYLRPGKPVDSKVREFLRYVLSREGQDAAQKDGKYLPLPARLVAEQLKKLD